MIGYPTLGILALSVLFQRSVVFVQGQTSGTSEDRVEEEIWIRPLEDVGKVITHYEFSLSELAPASSALHYQLFPKVIGQLIDKYDIDEMKFTITGGNWNHLRWGEPFQQGPFGAEISAKFRSQITVSSRQWKGYKSEMAALFSVSFGLLDETRSMEHLNPHSNATFLVGVLPREDICTENLTPWLKLLPCRTHAGLGQLIAPIAASTSDYYALSISAQRLALEENHDRNHEPRVVLRLTQTLTTVLPMKPVDGYTSLSSSPKKKNESKPWILRDVLGLSPEQVTALTKCPFAHHSRVYVEDHRLAIEPDSWLTLDREWYAPVDYRTSPRIVGVFHLSNELNRLELLNTPLLETTPPRTVTSPYFVLDRYVTGYGQALGGIAIHIQNTHPENATVVVYEEHIPWFLRIYFHTLRMSINGHALTSPFAWPFTSFDYEPAENHGRPNEIRFELELPPASMLILSFQFEKAFLQFQEYPPDSNRGMDLSSAKVEFYDPVLLLTSAKSRNAESPEIAWSELVLRQESQVLPYVIYSHALLVPLPVPDFSMPYNVITLSSTVIAFFFGSMVNTLLRRKRGSKSDRLIAKKKKAMLKEHTLENTKID